MTTVEADIRLDVHIPKGPTPFIIPFLDMIEEKIHGIVLTLATGKRSERPDLIDRLRKADLLDDTQNDSVMVDDYHTKVDKVQTIKSQLRDQNEKVDSSSYATFETSNHTFDAIEKEVGALNEIIDAALPGEDHKITFATEMSLVTAAFDTLGKVEEKVAEADKQIQEFADRIRRSTPAGPNFSPYASSSSGGPTRISRTPWNHSNGDYVPDAPVDGAGKAIKAAWGELKRGVSETNGNNVVDAPYNINDAWCASFADWAWRQGNIEVPWPNKNYVPSIWDYASGRGWTDPISTARPGDLIVWGDQGHIGLVVAVNGNNITTIEGNSSDRVQENNYDLSKGGFMGVIHPPGSQSPAVGSRA
ncbi:CHAP domain-containing protein [Nocardia sp. GCM10030253]|uniref:CHAP domain-containing protein n=1 Tax=Nocardia sp. GCM10030253 TaxID=3273404 RepID=UPI00363ABBDF